MTGYVFATQKKVPKVGFPQHRDDLRIQTWRDNWDIHKFFHDLYRASGGCLSGSPVVRLDIEDILLFEYEGLKTKKDEEAFDVYRFCKTARGQLDSNNSVYYIGEL